MSCFLYKKSVLFNTNRFSMHRHPDVQDYKPFCALKSLSCHSMPFIGLSPNKNHWTNLPNFQCKFQQDTILICVFKSIQSFRICLFFLKRIVEWFWTINNSHRNNKVMPWNRCGYLLNNFRQVLFYKKNTSLEHFIQLNRAFLTQN